MPLTSEQLHATIEWITVPAGTFTMGSPEDESGRWSDEILQQVTLRAFKMSKYEVTFDQYDLFCEATGRVKPDDNGWGRGTRPVIWITWNDAVAFAEWIGCRLPTESEWEYACRAGTNTVFNMGDNLNTSEANFDGNYPYEYGEKGIFLEKTTPVGSFAPNQWGLYDMHGNVCECCSDRVGDYSTVGEINPYKPRWNYRIVRGGSWFSSAQNCRSACRLRVDPGISSDDLGFRIVSDKLY